MHDTHSLTHFPSHTQRLPPGYRDLIEFFSRDPGLVKWTGTRLLLYFDAGWTEERLLLYFDADSLDALGSAPAPAKAEPKPAPEAKPEPEAAAPADIPDEVVGGF